MEPQRALVLVRERGEGFPSRVIEDVVFEAVDDVLAGAIRQQHDPFGHFLDPLPLAHPEGGEHGRHRLSLLSYAVLGFQLRHGQSELVDHEFTEHHRRQVAQELGQILCVIHLRSLGQVWIGLASARTSPYFLSGQADR